MSLKLDLIAPGELGEGERALWRAWAEADPACASPFLRPEFAEIAGQAAPGAAIAVFTREGRTVGFFPHQRRRRAVQPLAAPLNDYHGVIAAPGETPPSLTEVARLLGASSVSVNGWIRPDAAGQERTVVMADLSSGWAAYDAERRTEHKKFFNDKDRARRSLARDSEGEVWTQTHVVDTASLDELIGWKREQYRRTRRHDVFACGWTADVLHALMSRHVGDFGACLSVLWAGDRPAAMEFSLHAGDRYHFWFPSYAADAARCSPGVLLSQDTMRLLSAEGFHVFDFGFAGEPYKKYFCNRSETVVEGVVHASPVRRLAVRAADAIAIGPAARLTGSLRRRWAVVEACETTTAGRLRGAASAAAAGFGRLRAEPSSQARNA